MTSADELIRRIEAREARIGVVGLGYVGLPVAVAFADAGFQVVGIDLNPEKVRELNEAISYVGDVSSEELSRIKEAGLFRASMSFDDLRDVDAVLICVPTPITEGAPDLSSVVSAGTGIAPVVKPHTLVVLESTTYPGSTEELVRPLLESGGHLVGRDLFLAYSPERIDPGNPLYHFSDIPKIVGGSDQASARVATTLYAQVVPKVVPVSSTREAELAKLIENTYRHVNIALVNELAIYAHELGIDIWEAIEAAASKPFGYMPFWPGPGWGGHCIPLDPSYLSWRVRRERSHEVKFVELAQAVNAEMPRHVVERVSLLLNDVGRPIRNARVLVVGIAYKSGVDDTREAGAVKVLDRLAKLGARIDYHDPLVERVTVDDKEFLSVPLVEENVSAADLVVVCVPQVQVEWDVILKHARKVLDCCNALGHRDERVSRL